MRFTTQKLLLCLFLSLTSISFPSYALSTDQDQPINIESLEQSADLQANKLVFAGDVIATQGSIKVKAEKVEVTRNSNGTLKSIIAYGTPVSFEQQMDNGKYIRSNSNTLSYLPESSVIVLQGRATIWQGESRMTGERIEYNIKTQRMRANTNNSQGGRVSSTFVPSDFKNK